MKRPLIPVALLYALGILLAWRWTVPLFPLFAAAAVLLPAFLIWKHARATLLCLLLVLTGWINLAQRTAMLSPYDLRTILGQHRDALVMVRGTLCDAPQRRVRKEKNREIASTTAQIEVSAIGIYNLEQQLGPEPPWQPATGRVITSTKDLLPDSFFAGQTVEVFGVLSPPDGALAEGLFDYRAYLEQHGIYYSLRVEQTNGWYIVSSPAHPPLADSFCAWAKHAIAHGLPFEDESLRLEWALTLGWKAALTEEVSEPFIRAATYHIFAVDGLRIAIVSGILIGLLRVLGVPRTFCGVLAVPFILFYAAMTGWPASAVRAIVMIMVVFGGWMLKRPSDLINSLFAAALVILVWEPRQLFQAGFQLSFFVVLCIILIRPFFDLAGKWLLRTDPLLPDELRPRWQRMLRTSLRWLLDLFLASVAAWLGSIPLVAYYFHLVTPLSGLANVPAIPFCMFVLICNLSSLLLAGWLPFVAELFNHSGWFWMRCIQTTSHWSANWPGAYFYVPMPGPFTMAIYYLILLTTLTGWLFRGKWRVWKITCVSLLTVIWCAQWLGQRPVTHITILPLYGGYATYVQSPGLRNAWLVDCGNESSIDSVVKPFLRAQGVNRLPNFILTHGDMAYTGGAEALTDLFQPRKIYTNIFQFRSPSYRDFQAAGLTIPDRRSPLRLGDQTGPWTVLHPSAEDHFPKAEDESLVLRAEINDTRILLLSGLGKPGQRALLARTNDLRADIVVAGIPDQGEPLSDLLLDAIQPRLIIIADTKQPATKQAGATLKAHLASRNIPVIYTAESAAVTLSVQRGRWDLRAMDGTRLSGKPVGIIKRDPSFPPEQVLR